MASAAFPAVVLSLLGAATLFLGSASASWHAHELVVGGDRGWRKPMTPGEESFNHWAARNRFHVGDFLHFMYEKNDSVLVVTRDAYQLCVVDKPTMHFEGGDTKFRLDHSGSCYFISGTAGNCDAGQRMTLRVMVPQQQDNPDAPARAPSDAMSPDGEDEGEGEGEGGTFDPPPGGGGARRPSPPGMSSPGSGSDSGTVSRPPPHAVTSGDGNKTGAAGSTHEHDASSSSPSLIRGHRVLALALLALLLLPA